MKGVSHPARCLKGTPNEDKMLVGRLEFAYDKSYLRYEVVYGTVTGPFWGIEL